MRGSRTLLWAGMRSTFGAAEEYGTVRSRLLRGDLPILKPPRRHRVDGAEGLVVGEEIGDEAAGDGGEAEAHHGVAGGGDEVGEVFDLAEVRDAVRRDGAQAGPGLDVGEVFFTELGEV